MTQQWSHERYHMASGSSHRLMQMLHLYQSVWNGSPKLQITTTYLETQAVISRTIHRFTSQLVLCLVCIQHSEAARRRSVRPKLISRFFIKEIKGRLWAKWEMINSHHLNTVKYTLQSGSAIKTSHIFYSLVKQKETFGICGQWKVFLLASRGCFLLSYTQYSF